MIVELLEKVGRRQDLTRAELAQALDSLIDGDILEVQFAGLLMGLRVKGETVEEMIGAASVLRARALKIPVKERPLLCTAGTGGDGSGGLNLSTAAALIAAGAGASVAKHGNKAISSKCGSSDVLEALGIRADVPIPEMARALEDVGIAFLFAPLYHPATKAVASIRRQLGVRTLFNLLGPLTNPANVRCQLVGVYHPSKTMVMGEALRGLGCERALVVSAEAGLDEISPQGATVVVDLRGGELTQYTVTPADFGFEERSLDSIKGGDPAYNAAALKAILSGEDHPARPAVLMNAAAALVACDFAPNFKAGAELAAQVIDDGRAMAKINALRDLFQAAA
ncbi:anthranilate phosphoribosyltransferase [Lacibacterium aquatile]|uniref:Anthranilate phosphoribosyltransferase n=1 Tax=Lacibacterium aquatile TaxID=1168082 RepID=A0ABW5DNK5_9PROT